MNGTSISGGQVNRIQDAPQKEIAVEYQRLCLQVDRLEKVAAYLYEVCGPAILSGDSVGGGGGGDSKEDKKGETTVLGSGLRHQNNKLNAIANSLENLGHRIQL